ncbi:PH domain-containing protein [Balneola sp. MJW-20]|uniref:PH domain-containing protein n=1 Tax=Gracilimonas aurantiaca TaxID=3234185 RepID=UPI0034668BE3
MSDFKRQHPVASITSVLELIKQNLVTFLILLFIGTTRGEDSYFLYFFIGGAVFALVAGVVRWWRFEYRVYGDELQIRKGLFVRSQTFLSKERIQVIDITEGLIQRLFGLVKVEIKTAGGGTQTATISAVQRSEANRLRTELRKTKTDTEGDISSEEGVSLADNEEDRIIDSWTISSKDLLLAAFTSGNFGLIASILGATAGQLDNFINEETIEYLAEIIPGYSDWTVIVFLILAIIIISWFLSFLGVIFRYSDFRLDRTSDELIITSGLIERKHITIPFDRIQAVRFVEGLLRQPFGYGMIYVESAGYNVNQQETSIVMIPLISRLLLGEAVKRFLPSFDEPEFTIRPPKKALFRYLRKPAYILVILIPALWYFLEYGWTSLFLLPLAVYIGWLQYRDAALALGDNVLRIRSRFLKRTTALIRKNRVMNAGLSSNPFQRRKELQKLVVTAASGARGIDFEINDLDAEDGLEAFRWVIEHE